MGSGMGTLAVTTCDRQLAESASSLLALDALRFPQSARRGGASLWPRDGDHRQAGIGGTRPLVRRGPSRPPPERCSMLIPCPECKQKISSDAPSCPKCGRPLSREEADRLAVTERRTKTGCCVGCLCLVILLVIVVIVSQNSEQTPGPSKPVPNYLPLAKAIHSAPAS